MPSKTQNHCEGRDNLRTTGKLIVGDRRNHREPEGVKKGVTAGSIVVETEDLQLSE